jgi:DNA-binding beta-propeller fold protein YncE
MEMEEHTTTRGTRGGWQPRARAALAAFALSALMGVAGCGSSQASSKADDALAAQQGERECDTEAIGSDATMQGATVAVLHRCGRTFAFVADADAEAIRTVDVDSKVELAVTDLSSAPAQLLATADGELLVALPELNRVERLELAKDPAKPLLTTTSIATPLEPVGLALTPEGDTLLVTSRWAATLTGYDLASGEEVLRSELPRDPYAVVASDDGSKAFVSHVVGSPSVVNIGPRRTRPRPVELLGPTEGFRSERRVSRQGYAFAMTKDGRLLAPQVLVDPGNPESRSSGYGQVASPHLPNIAVVDQDAEAALISSLQRGPRLRQGWSEQSQRCLLPRAAVVDQREQTLLVACLGIGSVIEYDAMSATPNASELRRWHVAGGPTGIALDERSQRAVVWSQFEQTVSVIDLGHEDPLAGDPAFGDASGGIEYLAMSREAGAANGDLSLGRRLFHTVADTSISRDGRTCASCHPDGRDDGLTWSTPNGPRQTPMLAGRLGGTAPYGWQGEGKDLAGHLQHTFRRLGGQGLRGRELTALISYVASMKAPAPAHRKPLVSEAKMVERGRLLFHSKKTACATCHNGKSFSDGKTYDVGSKATADGSDEFDTPSLASIGATAPYFHDGRYSTLDELLRASDGRMGHTGHLSDRDVAALTAYLETL